MVNTREFALLLRFCPRRLKGNGQNRKNGLLVSDIYAGLDEILSNESLYSSIKENAFLDERYLIENTKPELLKILDREYTEEVFT